MKIQSHKSGLRTSYRAITRRNYARKMLNFGHVNSSPLIVRFGTFEINFQTGELRQRGQKIKLQEQPLQVLAALLERSGELVTREELHRKLWPSDTFVDFDHSLNAAVKRLRDALGESAVMIKFFIKTRPLKQWEIKREMQRRIKNKFDSLRIEIPFPHRTVYYQQIGDAGTLPTSQLEDSYAA